MVRQGSKFMILETSLECKDIDEDSAPEDSLEEIKVMESVSANKHVKKTK